MAILLFEAVGCVITPDGSSERRDRTFGEMRAAVAQSNNL
jgi:hypothetical protein